MAMLLNHVRVPDERTADSVNVKLDVGRTLALMLLGLACLVGSFVLWLVDEDSAAPFFFALGEAIVIGGFGIALGERNGASTLPPTKAVPAEPMQEPTSRA